MNREELLLRWREAVTWLRARVTLRRVLRVTLITVAAATVTITVEAVVRARILSPTQRMPSALYTRPAAWGARGESRQPVPIGRVDGGVMEQRIPKRLGDLPDQLIDAVLAVEDQRFRRHNGLDVLRIGGALIANIKAGAITQGGSTITQQLAKNLFLSTRRTPLRKVREAAFAMTLEARYTKDQILEAYLNEIYLGQDAGREIHGVGAAARYYFNKDVRRITLGEAALLAGMISAPNRYAPSRHPRAARERRDLVLSLMVEQQRITSAAAARARRAGVPNRVYRSRSVDGRHFRDFALAALPSGVPSRGVAVYTTIDAALQRAAELALRSGLDRLGARGPEAALVAIDPRTGEILAMVGGRDYGASQFNRAAEARRQPGSAFKPVVAVAALERQANRAPAFTLASIVEDEPLRVRTPSGPWEPANYDRSYRGRVTVREAMEQSLNIPFARIGLTVGPDRVADAARRLGITSPLNAVPSLALGSSEVTLLEMVRAYGVLAAAGRLSPTGSILGTARYGESLAASQPADPAQVIDPAVAYLVTSTLEGVVARGTGRALNQDGRFRALAGKTGTSNDWRDAWFVAYSPTIAVGVWVGFDDGRSLRLTGAGAALPIVARFLAEAGDDRWDGFDVPEGITEGYVTLAGGGWFAECAGREVFLEGTEPSGDCFRFRFPDEREERDWGRALKRGAIRLLEELIGQQLEDRRSRR